MCDDDGVSDASMMAVFTIKLLDSTHFMLDNRFPEAFSLYSSLSSFLLARNHTRTYRQVTGSHLRFNFMPYDFS